MSTEAMKLVLEAIGDLRGYRPDIDSAIETLRTAIQQAAARTDVRCEGCGYMTHHREHMGCVRAAKQHTHPAPSVPDDVVRVPMQILKDASEALGNFVSDHGWGDADMQAMDNLDAYIARHEANRAAMPAAK